MGLVFRTAKPLMGVWCNDGRMPLQSNGDGGGSLLPLRSSNGRDAVVTLTEELLGYAAKIEHTVDGAPYLVGSALNISISHTKGYAAVILSEASMPGIDIEYPSERAWRLSKRFLGSEELEIIRESLSWKETLSTLFWCAKETAFKILRLRGVDFINHLHIRAIEPPSSGGVIRLQETRTPENRMFTINYQIADDYLLTWQE